MTQNNSTVQDNEDRHDSPNGRLNLAGHDLEGISVAGLVSQLPQTLA